EREPGVEKPGHRRARQSELPHRSRTEARDLGAPRHDECPGDTRRCLLGVLARLLTWTRACCLPAADEQEEEKRGKRGGHTVRAQSSSTTQSNHPLPTRLAKERRVDSGASAAASRAIILSNPASIGGPLLASQGTGGCVVSQSVRHDRSILSGIRSN